MYEYAITVIGHDRPGIIADVSAVLADLGLNLTDSSMTLLRGHFAMTLICAGEPSATVVEAALAPLSGPGTAARYRPRSTTCLPCPASAPTPPARSQPSPTGSASPWWTPTCGAW